jgi:hypothetical protein
MMRQILQQAIIFTTLALVLSSCVQPPVFKAEGYALIESSYPVVAINGEDIAKRYRLDLAAGENTLTVVYNTYQYDYLCVFSWNATADTVYEITDQENAYPLTLYRWYRRNSLWAIRLEPVDPLACKRV